MGRWGWGGGWGGVTAHTTIRCALVINTPNHILSTMLMSIDTSITAFSPLLSLDIPFDISPQFPSSSPGKCMGATYAMNVVEETHHAWRDLVLGKKGRQASK